MLISMPTIILKTIDRKPAAVLIEFSVDGIPALEKWISWGQFADESAMLLDAGKPLPVMLDTLSDKIMPGIAFMLDQQVTTEVEFAAAIDALTMELTL